MTWTILHHACEHQNITEILNRSRSNSEEAMEVDDHGSTPLHLACYNEKTCHKDVLEALIEANPNVIKKCDRNGDTPLHILLMHCGSACNNKEDHPIEDVVELLLLSCPDVANVMDKDGLFPLHTACKFTPNSERVIKMLIDSNPLAVSKRIKMGNPVKRIKKDKSHPQHMVIDGNTRPGPSSTDLHFSFRNQNRQPRNGSYPIHIALSNNAHCKVISLLLSSSASNNLLLTKNKYGATPLHIALLNNSPIEVVELLLSFNDKAMADNNNLLAIKDYDGNLPLHYAIIGECPNDIIQLVANGYPKAMLEKNNDNKTPFECTEEDKLKVGEGNVIHRISNKTISTTA